MHLEDLDMIVRENLAKATESLENLRLNDAMNYFSQGYDAAYVMRWVGGIHISNEELRARSHELDTYSVRDELREFGMTPFDVFDLHEGIREFYAEKGYTSTALQGDLIILNWHGDLIREARRGCFLDAQKTVDGINRRSVEGHPWYSEEDKGKGLPKPLISEKAKRTVVDYARSHGEDGLEFWLQHAENHVNEGFMSYPTEIPHYARETIESYADALGVPFPEERFQQILKVNARNVALDRIRVLQRHTGDGDWIEKTVSEAKKYAEQAGLGLVYRFKLSRARKQAEKRLLTA